MSPYQQFETQRIDHLVIVAGICQQIGLTETIDQQVGQIGALEFSPQG